jgi:hypothetical protein
MREPDLSVLGADHSERFLTTPEAAAMLRLSPRTLEKIRVEGCGPKFHKAGRGIRAKVLYRPADIMEWIKALSFHSTSEYGKQDERDPE